jgi:hypothetical protein
LELKDIRSLALGSVDLPQQLIDPLLQELLLPGQPVDLFQEFSFASIAHQGMSNA